MGAGESRERVLTAETELLAHGRNWWLSSPRRPAAAPATSLVARDVAIGVPAAGSVGAAAAPPDGPAPRGQHIHTVMLQQEPPPAGAAARAPPLVLVHGYGTGLGYWYPGLTPLAERWPGAVYAVDALGSGLSTRTEEDSARSVPTARAGILLGSAASRCVGPGHRAE